jgi:hypothetical protein
MPSSRPTHAPAGDDTTPAELAERLAVMLGTFGMQRMHARVFCALLFTPEETLTAAQLGEQLAASAGSISGALKMLATLGVVERVHRGGDRRDHWRFRDDAWAVMVSRENDLLAMMIASADRGAQLSGVDSVAGRRLASMRDFYTVVLDHVNDLVATWQRERQPR